MSDAIYLKDCPHCQGNDYLCVWCEGEGRVVISTTDMSRQIQVEKAKLKYYDENKEKHFDSKINYYEDYDENDNIKSSARERIDNEIADDVANSIKEITRLEKLMNTFNLNRIADLHNIYKPEITTSTLCELCKNDNRKYICRTCNNNPENVFNEDCTQNFKGENEIAQQWYDEQGYKLESY